MAETKDPDKLFSSQDIVALHLQNYMMKLNSQIRQQEIHNNRIHNNIQSSLWIIYFWNFPFNIFGSLFGYG